MSAEPTKANFEATPAQLRAANPKDSIWVSANAGSGKTHVLVERVVRLLLNGADPASILCITYTKAAAAEMADRLFKRLGEWTALSDEGLADALFALGENGQDKNLLAHARRLFTAALETPGGLKIQTIHAFCERLLHLFPVEAGLAPGFSVLDERSAEDLRQRAINHVMSQAERDDGTPLAKAFANLADRLNKEQFDALIKTYVETLAKLGPEVTALDRPTSIVALKQALGIDQNATLETASSALINIDRTAFARHAELMKPFGKHGTVEVPSLLLQIAQAEDPLPALIKYFTTGDGENCRAINGLASKVAKAAHPETELFLEQQQALFWQRLVLRNTLDIVDCSTDAFILAKAILARLENEKRRSGQYDFSDLISRTARLLSSRRATQWVLYKLDKGLTHILLDEAQDTGFDQWQIVNALSQEFFAGEGESKQSPRTLFVVGDQKQSIYSFQGADARAYEAVKQNYVGPPGPLKIEELAISYRSTKPVLDAVNAIFSVEGLKQAGITALNENPHQPTRLQAQGIVEIWPLLEFDAEAPPDPWLKPIDRPAQAAPKRLLARDIAQKIKSWINPENPRKLAGSNKPVKADDILILFRRRNDIFRLVLAELRAADVPVSGADRLSLLGSLIVKDLLVLLQALLLPQDDHALAVILKSPLVPMPLSEEELFNLAYIRKRPLMEIVSGENAERLLTLRELSKTVGPHALLAHILNESRRDIMARLGNEAIEASDALLDYALDYEVEHGPSIFGFLRWFEATDTVLKREMEKGSGAVRMMTVHGAKGLEAPIVILADAAYVPRASNKAPPIVKVPSDQLSAGLPVWLVSEAKPYSEILESWKQNVDILENEESRRLLYVAMTRAADELYITGVAPKKSGVKRDSWWEIITEKLGSPTAGVPKRFGAADVWLSSDVKMESQAAALPLWLGQPAAVEKPNYTRSVTALTKGPKNYNAAAARHGRAVHKLLEELADASPTERASLAISRAEGLGLTKPEASRLALAISQPELSPFLGPQSRSETDLIGTLSNGRRVTGRLDRLAVTGAGIWLLDYKTDRSATEAKSDYLRQMAAYVYLLRQAHPGRPVTAALLWTRSGELEILPEAHLTAALQEVEQAEA